METKPLPKTSIGQRLLGIVVCFLLFSFAIGFLKSAFQDQLNSMGVVVNALITLAINFILLLASMAIIKSKTQFEIGDWKKIAARLIVIEVVLSVIGLLGTSASYKYLGSITGYSSQGLISNVMISWLISVVGTTLLVLLASWLVLSKPNAETVSQTPPTPPM